MNRLPKAKQIQVTPVMRTVARMEQPSTSALTMEEKKYGELSARIRRLQKANALPVYPTEAQRIDWAYGNAAIENSSVTREIVERVALTCPSPQKHHP